MTLQIEIEPQIEARLRTEAEEDGISVEEMAARWLQTMALSDEEFEALEDEIDLAEIRKRLAEEDPFERVILRDMRPRETQ